MKKVCRVIITSSLSWSSQIASIFDGTVQITALLSAVIRYIDPSREFNSAHIRSIQYGDVNCLQVNLRVLGPGSGAEPNAVRCGARNTDLRSKEDKREIK